MLMEYSDALLALLQEVLQPWLKPQLDGGAPLQERKFGVICSLASPCLYF